MITDTVNDYKQTLQLALEQTKAFENKGKVASYIPELSKISGDKLGVHLVSLDNKHYSLGDSHEKFSIQSIAKVLTLTLAFESQGDKLWERVGVEPSGSAFNSLVQLEFEKGIPRNPFINAGAIVICDILIDIFDDPKLAILNFIRQLSGNNEIGFNKNVAISEKSYSYRNKALTNLMKDFGNIKNDIDIVLDFYFHLCSIEMTCEELAQCFTFLASHGVNPLNNKLVLSVSKTKRINAIMQLCGFYDEAGEFSFKVGLPGKSGVGGGIIAVHPGNYSIAVWSPKLNDKGNSYRGLKILEAVTTISQSSIF